MAILGEYECMDCGYKFSVDIPAWKSSTITDHSVSKWLTGIALLTILLMATGILSAYITGIHKIAETTTMYEKSVTAPRVITITVSQPTTITLAKFSPLIVPYVINVTQPPLTVTRFLISIGVTILD